MVVFREARIEDFEQIQRLYRQLNPDDPQVTDGSDATAFATIIDRPGLYLFVLDDGGAIVATTYLNVIPNLSRSASPFAVVENIVVEKELRGTGLGKRIMADTLQVAWDAGCYKAMLMTGSRRPSTLAFYEACGFDPDAKSAFLARPPRLR